MTIADHEVRCLRTSQAKGGMQLRPETSHLDGLINKGIANTQRRGSQGKALVSLTRFNPGSQIVSLADENELANQREDLRARLMSDRAGQLMRSILNERRKDTVVTVDNELLQRFAPNRT